MKSWKTTSAGIVTIVGAVVGFYFALINHAINETTVTGSVTALLTGIGLLFAKDSNVTGGTTSQ